MAGVKLKAGRRACFFNVVDWSTIDTWPPFYILHSPFLLMSSNSRIANNHPTRIITTSTSASQSLPRPPRLPLSPASIHSRPRLWAKTASLATKAVLSTLCLRATATTYRQTSSSAGWLACLFALSHFAFAGPALTRAASCCWIKKDQG